ncbi:PAS domain-containing protein [Arcicella rosea]|uniref:PAS domain S-box-containing protein n=1 Tax=Arcicella rosea TaxID=502909 RepID=A0A841EMA6_9BACT|nr:PAS domain-containing protein [Arcicella rosea]MBB6003314.1 PAS domain S-box-containing protein [Arcicella rosea]
MENTKFLNLDTNIKSEIMKHVLYNMPMVIYLFDIHQRRNLFTNEQYHKEIGYTTEEFDTLGKDCLNKLIHPDDFGGLKRFYKELACNKNSDFYIHINRCLCKNGTFKWFKNCITILEREKSGVPLTVLGIAFDITAQVETRQKLFDQIYNIEKVSFKLSHELRHEHSKILSILNLSKDNDMIEIGDIQWLANALHTSAESIDKSIYDISQQLHLIKSEFISLNSTQL